MKSIVTILFVSLLASASAYPPAPYHEIYGTVRDELGTPIKNNATIQILDGAQLLLSAPVDGTQTVGFNYSLKIPMDAAILTDPYQPNALQPADPFSLRVLKDNQVFYPIEVGVSLLNVGTAASRTRLDLTLGVDSDGDGIPDAWEAIVVAATPGIDTIFDLLPDGDADGDGVTNYDEYYVGTYAFDRRASFGIEIMEINNGIARLRFLSAPGRGYRLRASTDLTTFLPVEFSIKPDASDPSLAFIADRVRYQDIYLPVDSAPNRFFRLYVD